MIFENNKVYVLTDETKGTVAGIFTSIDELETMLIRHFALFYEEQLTDFLRDWKANGIECLYDYGYYAEVENVE